MHRLSKRVSQKRNNEIYAYEMDGTYRLSHTVRRCENNDWNEYEVWVCRQSDDDACMSEFDSYEKFVADLGCCPGAGD